MKRLLPLLVAAALSLSACGNASPSAGSATATPANLPSTKVVSETETCVELFGANENGPLFVAVEVMKELTDSDDAVSKELTSKVEAVSKDLEKISSSANAETKKLVDSVNETFVGLLAATGTSFNIKVESFKTGGSELLDRCPPLIKDSSKSTPSPSPSPSPSATLAGASYAFTCKSDAEYSLKFSSYKEAWASGKALDLCTVTLSRGVPSAMEKELAVAAYGNEAKHESPVYLHSICAVTAGHYVDSPLSDAQAREARAAMKLCPDHPKRAQIEANATEGEAQSADQAEGRMVGPGKYLVGTDVQPGTWQSQGAKVEDCYWEISDASGNILQNNFISVAPQFTIRIPATAAGFTASGCSFRWING